MWPRDTPCASASLRTFLSQTPELLVDALAITLLGIAGGCKQDDKQGREQPVNGNLSHRSLCMFISRLIGDVERMFMADLTIRFAVARRWKRSQNIKPKRKGGNLELSRCRVGGAH